MSPRVVPVSATAQPFRVLRHPGARQQSMSAGQAAMLGELSAGQRGPFSDNYGNVSSLGPRGSNGADQLASSVGLGNNASSYFGGGIDKSGRPYSNMLDPFGAGSLLGAVLRQTQGGRDIASQVGAHYGGFGGMSNPYQVGGRLYGRGTPTQWVSGGGGRSETTKAREMVQVFVDVAAPLIAGYLFGATRIALRNAKQAAEDTAKQLNKAEEQETVWADFDAEDWDPMQWVYGRRGGSGTAGYYPRVTPGQSGHPTVSAYMMQSFAEQLKRMGQQAHAPRSSETSGRGGTSMAPVLLHGMKHGYDWVAGSRGT